MLDLVPLAGARRKVTHLDRQAALIGPALQFPFPPVVARAVAPPAIGGDQQPGGPRVAGLPHRRPPLADAGHGKHRRIMIPYRHSPNRCFPSDRTLRRAALYPHSGSENHRH